VSHFPMPGADFDPAITRLKRKSGQNSLLPSGIGQKMLSQSLPRHEDAV